MRKKYKPNGLLHTPGYFVSPIYDRLVPAAAAGGIPKCAARHGRAGQTIYTFQFVFPGHLPRQYYYYT